LITFPGTAEVEQNESIDPDVRRALTRLIVDIAQLRKQVHLAGLVAAFDWALVLSTYMWIVLGQRLHLGFVASHKSKRRKPSFSCVYWKGS
jgi:type IV secretory pathway TrbD component